MELTKAEAELALAGMRSAEMLARLDEPSIVYEERWTELRLKLIAYIKN